jgi:hypothetical protein
VEVVLGEADAVIAELVAEPDLLQEFRQHRAVEIAAHAGHAGLDLRAAADGREIEERRFQDWPSAFDPLSHGAGEGIFGHAGAVVYFAP